MRILATLGSLLLAGAAGAANTLHVTAVAAAGGSGSSWDDPVALRTACERARAGDTVLVRAGDYGARPRESACAIAASGTAAAPITLRGEGGSVLIRRELGWAKLTGAWLVVEDLGCTDTRGACVVLDGARHARISNLVVRNAWRAVDARGTSDSLFEGLRVSDSREGIYLRQGSHRNLIRGGEFTRIGTGDAGDRCAICIGERAAGEDNRIEDNLVTDSGAIRSDYAITVYSAPRTRITNNVVRGSRSGGIMVTQYSTDSLIAGNLVEDSGTCGPGWSNIAGITVRNASSGTEVRDNRILRQTVCPGNPWGDTSPRGALDLRGWNEPHRALEHVVLRDNLIEGTRGGPDVYLHPGSLLRSIVGP